MSLKNIDFSEGIRSKEIQDNFKELDYGLRKERLSVAGPGICSGLDYQINDFLFTLHRGELVDKNGELISMNEKSINIELPYLTKVSDEIEINEEGKFSLLNDREAYSINRKEALTIDNITDNDIEIYIISNREKININQIVSINKSEFIVNSKFAGEKINISYYYTEKRLDTIYLDKDYNLQYIRGLESSSASIMLPEDHSHIIAVIEVDPYTLKNYNYVATCKPKDKSLYNKKRNLYTDDKNNLYICGTNFNKLNFIHYKRPEDPEIGTLWYNLEENLLMVFVYKDGIGEWVAVNDKSSHPMTEVKTYYEKDLERLYNNGEHDLQTFYFDEHEIYMRFKPNRNEVKVIINNTLLHQDQFEELTLIPKINSNGEEVLVEDNITLEDYNNAGCGIKLVEPLTRPSRVEIHVTHSIYNPPDKTRFQRSATFSHTNYIRIEENDFSLNKDFILNCPNESPYFRYGEDQLDVYLNGKKLLKNIEVKEITVRDNPEKIKGELCNGFKILCNLRKDDFIEYSIKTTVYSYDHVSKIFEDYNVKLSVLESNMENLDLIVKNNLSETNRVLNNFQSIINNMQNKVSEIDNCIKKNEVLDLINIPDQIKNNTPKSIFNKSFIKQGPLTLLDNIKTNDYVTAFNLNAVGANIVLTRGEDYEIVKDLETNSYYFSTLNPGKIEDGASIYITGINF